MACRAVELPCRTQPDQDHDLPHVLPPASVRSQHAQRQALIGPAQAREFSSLCNIRTSSRRVSSGRGGRMQSRCIRFRVAGAGAVAPGARRGHTSRAVPPRCASCRAPALPGHHRRTRTGVRDGARVFAAHVRAPGGVRRHPGAGVLRCRRLDLGPRSGRRPSRHRRRRVRTPPPRLAACLWWPGARA